MAAKKYIPAPLYELMEVAYGVLETLRLAWRALGARPDLVYQRANLYMFSGRVCAWLARVPYFLEVNAPLAEERNRFAGLRLFGLARRLEEGAWRAADRVLPVTHVLAGTIAAAGVPPSRIEVVANGVDLDRFAPGDSAEMRRRLALEGKLVLGFTGFVREWHGADTILDLLAGDTLPRESHFLIVGDGPAREALYDKARRLGVFDRLTITGVIPREGVAQYVRCFDIALQPEVVRYASPLKLMEYMALERAIIAPDRDNIRECVRHEESALLFEPENSASLAAALARLAGDAGLRRRLGQSARQTVLARPMTWEENARRICAMAAALQSARSIPAR